LLWNFIWYEDSGVFSRPRPLTSAYILDRPSSTSLLACSKVTPLLHAFIVFSTFIAFGTAASDSSYIFMINTRWHNTHRVLSFSALHDDHRSWTTKSLVFRGLVDRMLLFLFLYDFDDGRFPWLVKRHFGHSCWQRDSRSAFWTYCSALALRLVLAF
jgi:hypothetical protein